ncbi:hypothetical protein FGO68_gene13489 [Halteria grandinella]|uniref:Membrane protein insertion efficiency factor n=1 Tax=Halteria grandinella TaxID=5974 RepID=A0A8J8N8U1_HALGN|nr:hypothetical protein FGO68_gene13489 [Halteria grandinella]
MMRLLLAIPVRIYQALSCLSSPRCKYYPSCSNYAITAVRRYGVKGVGMAAWRLMRCNPWSHGGVDYVDEYLDSVDARKSDKKEVVGALQWVLFSILSITSYQELLSLSIKG